ncbi:MAG TPA: hypothetical protein VFT56_08415 [Sphingomonas sp.]|nr:hypothetical protein [Sphingomonas sp.]
MSFDMEDKFREIAGIGDLEPEFVVWAGSLDKAIKWRDMITVLAELAAEGAETGYNTSPLEEENSLLCWQTLHTLREMGVDIPDISNTEFPNDLDEDDAIDALLDNPYAKLIFNIFKSLNDVYGFFIAYIYELVTDDQLDVIEEGMEIESCLMNLAASKLEPSLPLATKFNKFKIEVTQDYERWLRKVQAAAFRAGVPIRAELLDLVYEGHDALGHEAEAESLGVNSRQLHPDIYMNELLCGMRAIHQILPVIIKKLEITEEELAFDVNKLRL